MSAAQLSLDIVARDIEAHAANILPPFVSMTLRHIATAEEELARAGNPPGVFPLLMPGVLTTFGVELYRAHCRELIARAAADNDTRPGTDAEVLAVMMETAARAPLRAQGQAVAEQLFAKLMPEAAVRLLENSPAREVWPGQVAEDVAAIRKRIAQAWRHA